MNDCSRFATGFFEVISKSAPHIYHSALQLSPKMSIVGKLYKPHIPPLTRIIHGLPASWDHSIATVKFPSWLSAAVWSPCSRFIAVTWGGTRKTIEILDAVTLRQLTTLESPLDSAASTCSIIFSPDANLLTWFGGESLDIITWDLQTGVLVNTISPEQQRRSGYCASVTYSTCGTMLGVLFCHRQTFTISTYNILSGLHIHSSSVEGWVLNKIWTCSEHIQFATATSNSITTWEVEFASTHMPRKVDSLPTPDNFDSSEQLLHRSSFFSGVLFHPATSRLAFTTGEKVMVWDGQHSRFLLDSVDFEDQMDSYMSFSLDGCFFANRSYGRTFYLWKESTTGYILHQKLIANTSVTVPCISPDGGSVITYGSTVQLWPTTNSTTTLSTTSAQAPQRDENISILGFSPNETLAAVAKLWDEMVTVLDLKYGIPKLTIDTNVEVCGLRVANDTITVVGVGKIVTWSISTENCAPSPRINANDCLWSTAFNHPPIFNAPWLPTASVSPDLHQVAIVELEECKPWIGSHLHLYDAHTGQCLITVPMKLGTSPWFTLDGCEVWCTTHHHQVEGWRIIKDGKSNIILEYLGSTPAPSEPNATLDSLESGVESRCSNLTKPECAGPALHPPDGFPLKASDVYEFVDSGWILSGKKRLLWLPPHWRSYKWDRRWSGHFLALVHKELPEAVILQLE